MRVHDIEGATELAISKQAIHSAASLLRTKMDMYDTIYHHPTNLLCLQMATRAAEMAIERGDMTIRDILRMTDFELKAAFIQMGDLPREIVLRILSKRLYKRILEAYQRDIVKFEHVLRIRDTPEEHRKLEEDICEAVGLRYGHLIIDIPDDPEFEEGKIPVEGYDGRRLLYQVEPTINLIWNDIKYSPSRWALRVYAIENTNEEHIKKQVRNKLLG
jgi:HD superfamily phosphohydrolase